MTVPSNNSVIWGLYKDAVIEALRKNQDEHNPQKTKTLIKAFHQTNLLNMVAAQPANKEESLAFYIFVENVDGTDANLRIESQRVNVNSKCALTSMEREILSQIRQKAPAIVSTIKGQYEPFYVKVLEISDAIHMKTLRGGASWLLTSPTIVAIFKANADFSPETDIESCSIRHVGTIDKRWQLYEDPLSPVNEILMGYRGVGSENLCYLDTGFIFLPHYLDESDILTYGSLLVNPNYFAKIVVENFA